MNEMNVIYIHDYDNLLSKMLNGRHFSDRSKTNLLPITITIDLKLTTYLIRLH